MYKKGKILKKCQITVAETWEKIEKLKNWKIAKNQFIE